MISKRATKEDVEDKVSLEQFNRLISTKSSNGDIDRLKAELGNLKKVIDAKLHQNEFLKAQEIILKKYGQLEEDIGQKSNIKDVCTLLDKKSNIEDVNRALSEIHTELDSKTEDESYQVSIREQNSINEILCAENCVARWLWKTGNLKNGFAVPWEVQSTNTCPENFLWEQEISSNMTVAPGLYEVSFSFL